jgi:hypothetical protein
MPLIGSVGKLVAAYPSCGSKTKSLRCNEVENEVHETCLQVIMWVCLLLMLLPLQSFAQAVLGSIFGTVTDSVIPSAKVTVSDVGKGTLETVTTKCIG